MHDSIPSSSLSPSVYLGKKFLLSQVWGLIEAELGFDFSRSSTPHLELWKIYDWAHSSLLPALYRTLAAKSPNSREAASHVNITRLRPMRPERDDLFAGEDDYYVNSFLQSIMLYCLRVGALRLSRDDKAPTFRGVDPKARASKTIQAYQPSLFI